MKRAKLSDQDTGDDAATDSTPVEQAQQPQQSTTKSQKGLLPMTKPLQGIEGLAYISDFITKDEEKVLIAAIDAQNWSMELSRRVQHYGYIYDYRARNTNASKKIGDLPDFVHFLVERIVQRAGIFLAHSPDQLIINGTLRKGDVCGADNPLTHNKHRVHSRTRHCSSR
jgi:hypothetical protein